MPGKAEGVGHAAFFSVVYCARFSWNRSNFLFLRIFRRKTGFHFS